MNGQSKPSPETITTEDLKAITQAPKSEEPLVSESELPVHLVRSSRPIWIQPIPKLALIGFILIPLFGLAALLLNSNGRFKQAQEPTPPAPSNEIASQPEPVPEELSRLRQENGKLKANAAIGDQNTLQNRGGKNGKPDQKLRPSTQAITHSPKPTTPTAAPPPMISQMSSPKLVAAPVSLPPSYTPVTRSTERSQAQRDIHPVDPDPMHQWQQLAQLGSYGSSQSQMQTDDSVTPSSPIPTARLTPTSAIQPNDGIVANAAQAEAIWDQSNAEQPGLANDQNQKIQADQATENATIVDTQSETLTGNPSTQPPILIEAEAAIFQEQIQPPSLIAGANAPGVLATPLTLSNLHETASTQKAVPNQFTIVLTQPLKDSTGQVAIPAGTHLLVQVDQFSQTGQVQVSATTAVWQENGRQKELSLPSGAIQIRGENGMPLVAKPLENRGQAIAAMDAGQFLLGAVRRSAQLLTRSNSQIQTGNGTTIISERNPAPNLLAGALEGGTDAILSSIQERNKQAIKDIEQRPNSYFIPSGSAVQVFVNQSMQLPN